MNSNFSSAILEGLRESVESVETWQGAQWGLVYLDNVPRPEGMTAASFRSILAHLSRLGLYRPEQASEFNGAWGNVRLPDAKEQSE